MPQKCHRRKNKKQSNSISEVKMNRSLKFKSLTSQFRLRPLQKGEHSSKFSSFLDLSANILLRAEPAAAEITCFCVWGESWKHYYDNKSVQQLENVPKIPQNPFREKCLHPEESFCFFPFWKLISLPPCSFRVRSRVQEVEGEQTQERFFRPHFLQAPGDMMAHEGRLCRLDCKVGATAGNTMTKNKNLFLNQEVCFCF